MKKIIFTILILVFAVLSFSIVKAFDKNLTGYVFNSQIGWVSLSCQNTNSCQNIDYKVLAENENLSGYGYSADAGWINFNPQFGEVILTQNNELYGWAFSQNNGWVYFGGEKIAQSVELENKINSVEKEVNLLNENTASMSAETIIQTIKSFCEQIFNKDICSAL